jgi:hypothetical protein
MQTKAGKTGNCREVQATCTMKKVDYSRYSRGNRRSLQIRKTEGDGDNILACTQFQRVTSFAKATLNAPPNPALWKEVWKYKSIPKIDMFIWTLAHNAILTGDNLKRKGWEGPTRCPFCVSNEETVAHILLNCSFAREVWNLALAPWTTQVTLPDEIPNLLLNWQALCPFSLTKKDQLKSCWGYLPKFICWKIWLERNARVFKGKLPERAK